MTQPAKVDVMEELAAIRQYFNNVHQELKAGRVIDITGFEKRIAALCTAVQQAPEALQQQCLPDLLDFISKLDEYDRDLRRAADASKVKKNG